MMIFNLLKATINHEFRTQNAPIYWAILPFKMPTIHDNFRIDCRSSKDIQSALVCKLVIANEKRLNKEE